jgi:hypothetical protein
MNISQHNSESLYVPIHKRSQPTSSTRSSQGSSCHTRDTDADDSKVGKLASAPYITYSPMLIAIPPAPSKRLTYSIRDLLQLSSSPHVRLSQQQIRGVQEHLSLQFTPAHYKAVAKGSRTASPTRMAPVVVDTVVAIQDTKQNTERSGHVRRRAGSPAELRNKKARWGYGVHTSGVQGDWRHSVVPALGA